MWLCHFECDRQNVQSPSMDFWIFFWKDPFLKNDFVKRSIWGARLHILLTFFLKKKQKINNSKFSYLKRHDKTSYRHLWSSRFPLPVTVCGRNDKGDVTHLISLGRTRSVQSTKHFPQMTIITHTHAHPDTRTMACLWGYYLRVSSGRSWVHRATLRPYLSRRHSLISTALPPPTSVPITHTRGKTKSILAL